MSRYKKELFFAIFYTIASVFVLIPTIMGVPKSGLVLVMFVFCAVHSWSRYFKNRPRKY